MGADYEQLLDQVTRHLSADRELQLEIRRELSIHLDDAAAEFAAGGRSEDEASELAIKALGPPEELASELYEANRRRMRWRGVLRRTALIALLPAAIMITLIPLLSVVMDQNDSSLNELIGTGETGVTTFDLAARVSRSSLKARIDALPEEKRFLFYGRPGDKKPADVISSIAQRWSDDPVYFAAHVAMQIRAEPCFQPAESAPVRPNLVELQPLMADIERGMRLEPQNAWYDFLKAAILLRAGGDVQPDAGPEVRGVKRDKFDKAKTSIVRERTDGLIVHDSEVFGQGLAAFKSGLNKPYMTSHGVDMLRRRLDAIGPPETLSQLVGRIALSIGIVMPELNQWRGLAKRVVLHSMKEAGAGRPEEALAWLQGVEILSGKLAARTEYLIEMQVAQSVSALAEHGRIAVFDMQGSPEFADATLARIEEAIRWRDNAVAKHGQIDKAFVEECSSLMRLTVPAVPGYRPDPEPLRTAEYALFEKAMIATVLLVIDVLAAMLGLGALALLWHERRSESKTPFLWIGWRRLARIGLWSLAVPLVAYAAYAMSPLGGRHHGLWMTAPRLLIEHVILLLVIVLLVTLLTGRALRQRAAEVAAIIAPTRKLRWGGWGWARWLRLGLALAATMIVGWVMHLPAFLLLIVGAGIWIATEVLGWSVLWVGYLVSGADGTSRLRLRALTPVLAMAVIVTGVVGYSAVSLLERSAIRRAGGSSGLDVVSAEISKSAYAEVRAEMVRKHDEALARMK